ncbi:LPS assembly lipoprotein LptE [Desulfonatronospira sp.]|uniref:LPS assembly lipoprotein LptE n=1 Tax=Desulfonatronospira sp. TaxID=1962951 RepID=UPI0025B88641|nr:LPS assembly lipoprotein LptE [Desulfonatronospira sp.]
MRAAALILMLTLSVGCGYNFTGMAPVDMPGDVSRLYLSRVDNPTLEVWLEPYVRTNFRDEFSRRADISWVDREEAQAYVVIDILNYRVSDGLTGAGDRTIRSQVRLDLDVRMYDSRTSDLLWSSGGVHGSGSYFPAHDQASVPGESTPGERQAAREAVEEALRLAADRLGTGF